MVPGTPRITIPERFDKILGNSPLGNGLRLYVQRFDAWVSDDTKGLFFFPEYTDHGPKHITSVLFGAEALIREEAWKAVTPEDVAVLGAAALLHDAAMHLSADGFLALIDPLRVAERPLIRPLDTQTWPELFAAYYSEARKWDQRRLHRILGDEKVPQEDEPDLIDSVRRPEEMPNPETWSTRYRKFLGEFVRRHHARLAHEIALYGYPGQTRDVLRLPKELSRLEDLAGLVARSHNMHLRDTFDYLQKKHWGRVTCQGAHPVFLMVLLRIADYLEIRSDRVNSTALVIQRLRSPISLEEQSSHLAVHEVRPDEHDEEAIFVIARPDSARLFLKLQNLLKGLQAELDTSWAVLGEVYSKQNVLSCFGITLRRVRSNMDSPSEYLRREEPSYFPIQAAFDTTGADLLKLLIKPLYGDRPEIGVRELLQNALDAVHELRQWASDNGDPEMKTISLPDQEADVLISIDKDKSGEIWLTVRDKGIGMTAEVVRDYFLKAGASYRESTAWRKEFEDERGSRVLRSGRFGVGALAAFLLGERMEVSTRHVSSPSEDGIHFAASIVGDVIELSRVQLQKLGTTVRIKLGRMALDALVPTSTGQSYDRWDWFALDDPVVERRVFGRMLEQRLHLPLPGKDGADGWNEISVAGLKSVLWKFDYEVGVICNGINTGIERKRMPWRPKSVPCALPAISIFDTDGRLPFNLQRDDLIIPVLPFEDELVVELSREVCAFLLLHAPTERVYPSLKLINSLAFYYPSLFHFYRETLDTGLWPVCFTEEGIVLFREDQARGVGQSCLCLVVKDSSVLSRLLMPAGDLTAVLFSNRDLDVETARKCIGKHFPHAEPRILSTKEDADSGSEVIKLDAGWKIYSKSIGGSPAPLLEAVHAKIKQGNPGITMALEWQLDAPSLVSDHPLATVMDSPIIPYDPAERRRKFPKAFSQLEKHLKRWESDNLTGWRLETVRWFRGELFPE